MNKFITLTLLAAFSVLTAAAAPEMKTIKFSSTDFYSRWSKDDQHEYTPKGQEDLSHWSEMVTSHSYRTVKTGEDLAATANSVLENYKAAGAMIIKTDSVPRTVDKPAEYLIVALIPQKDLIEAVFARFKLVDSMGSAVIYSHRENGAKVGNEMSAWLQKNGPATEKVLMNWDQYDTTVKSVR